MTVSSSSLPLALLGFQVAQRLLGVSVPTVSLLIVIAISAWTMPALVSRGIVNLALAIFAPRTRR
jgi:hypothetical protein